MVALPQMVLSLVASLGFDLGFSGQKRDDLKGLGRKKFVAGVVDVFVPVDVDGIIVVASVLLTPPSDGDSFRFH